MPKCKNDITEMSLALQFDGDHEIRPLLVCDNKARFAAESGVCNGTADGVSIPNLMLSFIWDIHHIRRIRLYDIVAQMNRVYRSTVGPGRAFRGNTLTNLEYAPCRRPSSELIYISALHEAVKERTC